MKVKDINNFHLIDIMPQNYHKFNGISYLPGKFLLRLIKSIYLKEMVKAYGIKEPIFDEISEEKAIEMLPRQPLYKTVPQNGDTKVHYESQLYHQDTTSELRSQILNRGIKRIFLCQLCDKIILGVPEGEDFEKSPEW